MNRTEHLLTIAVEECCEVGQRLTKMLRFGLDEIQPDQDLDNVERFRKEFADLIGVLRMIEEEKDLDLTMGMEWDIKAKQIKVESFLEYSEAIGTLDNERGLYSE